MVAPVVAAAAIGAGGSILGGLLGSSGASAAAKAQTRAAREAAAVQQRQFDITRQDMAPFRQQGMNALAAMAYEMGLGPRPQRTPGDMSERERLEGLQIQTIPGVSTAPPPSLFLNSGRADQDAASSPALTAARFEFDGQTFATMEEAEQARQRALAATRGRGFDYGGFQESPGYQFRRQQGMDAVQGSFAARGMRDSGAVRRALMEYGQGLASDEYGNFYNRLAAMSGTGQTATSQLSQLGAMNANNQAQGLIGAGQARASGYVGQTNALGQALGGVANAAGGFFGGMTPAQPVAPTGSLAFNPMGSFTQPNFAGQGFAR